MFSGCSNTVVGDYPGQSVSGIPDVRTNGGFFFFFFLNRGVQMRSHSKASHVRPHAVLVRVHAKHFIPWIANNLPFSFCEMCAIKG